MLTLHFLKICLIKLPSVPQVQQDYQTYLLFNLICLISKLVFYLNLPVFFIQVLKSSYEYLEQKIGTNNIQHILESFQAYPTGQVTSLEKELAWNTTEAVFGLTDALDRVFTPSTIL